MIRWNDNYITGIEKLDKEHQQLFQMADQVLNKLRERGDEANYRIFLVPVLMVCIFLDFSTYATHNCVKGQQTEKNRRELLIP